jgi:hypothetical protein
LAIKIGMDNFFLTTHDAVSYMLTELEDHGLIKPDDMIDSSTFEPMLDDDDDDADLDTDLDIGSAAAVTVEAAVDDELDVAHAGEDDDNHNDRRPDPEHSVNTGAAAEDQPDLESGSNRPDL